LVSKSALLTAPVLTGENCIFPAASDTLKYNKLEKCTVYRHKDPLGSASRPIPIAEVKTLTRGLGLRLDLWPFHPRVSACRGPAMIHMFTDFGADRLIAQAIFLLKHGQTDRQTDRRDLMPYPMPAAIQPALVINIIRYYTIY